MRPPIVKISEKCGAGLWVRSKKRAEGAGDARPRARAIMKKVRLAELKTVQNCIVFFVEFGGVRRK